MKKLFIYLFLVLLIVGCGKKETINDTKEPIILEEKEENHEIKEEIYLDENNTPIGLYIERQNKLELVDVYKTSITSGLDIGVFQIYPSNDKEVLLSNGFGNTFYNTWISLPNVQNLKIGFNVKYTLDSGEEVNYNILDYNVIFKEIYNYLYDDYANRFNSWYSHIEEKDYNEDTLYTSIKLYGADVSSIASKIYLTVFTYDDLYDFDQNNNYRGNSSYQITICDINKTCD